MTNSKVDAFIKGEKKWKAEALLIREIVLSCGLDEEIKWALPCFTSENRNIVIFQNFKDFCALMYFDGQRLTDKKGLLQKPGANSNITRRIEFQSVSEINKHKAEIKRLIKESLTLEPLKKTDRPKAETAVPKEFADRLLKSVKLKKAFAALTQGRQRQYLLFFGSAKQEATRIARIEKLTPRILEGLGIND